MDTISWPTNLMHETSQAISTENGNLLAEHAQYWQWIHDANLALPISMQETFHSFHTSIEANLAGALTLHQHIGQTLAVAADLAEARDTSIAQTFNGL